MGILDDVALIEIERDILQLLLQYAWALPVVDIVGDTCLAEVSGFECTLDFVDHALSRHADAVVWVGHRPAPFLVVHLYSLQAEHPWVSVGCMTYGSCHIDPGSNDHAVVAYALVEDICVVPFGDHLLHFLARHMQGTLKAPFG